MCDCKNIDFGTYENTVGVLLPFPTPRYPVVGTKPISLDRCIALEIIDLWNKGIETLESCCGHNKAESYVSVADMHIDAMLALGYVQKISTDGLKHEFKLKSA